MSLVTKGSGYQAQGVEKAWSEKSSKEKWMDVTTHRGWRHTIGRISCLARISIYGITTLLQTTKTVIKGIVSPVVSFIAWATDTKKLDSWTFSGVAKDAIMVGSLVDRTLNSALCVICAPPKKYHSLWGALKGSANILIGRHQDVNLTVHQLFFKETTLRAQYHKQIIQCDCVYTSKLGRPGNFEYVQGDAISTSNVVDKIKAG